MPPHQPGAAPANHDRSDHRATPHPGRQRTRRRTTHPRLVPPTPPPAPGLTGLHQPPPPPRRLVEPTPAKRPKSSYIRFAAAQPNERWQADFTHWRLAGGTDVEILCWLDDCSRLAISVTAHRRVTGTIVVNEFGKASADCGCGGVVPGRVGGVACRQCALASTTAAERRTGPGSGPGSSHPDTSTGIAGKYEIGARR